MTPEFFEDACYDGMGNLYLAVECLGRCYRELPKVTKDGIRGGSSVYQLRKWPVSNTSTCDSSSKVVFSADLDCCTPVVKRSPWCVFLESRLSMSRDLSPDPRTSMSDDASAEIP